jgi:tetratricopeptide (TPR) repeat protein
MGRAHQLYCEKRFEEAAAEYQRASEGMPFIGLSHLYRGESLLYLRRSQEAKSEMKRAVQLEPEDAHYRARLAMALWECRDVAEAEKEARAATRLDPNEGEGHFMLAKLLARQGRYKETWPELVQSLRSMPQNKEVKSAMNDFRTRHPGLVEHSTGVDK